MKLTRRNGLGLGIASVLGFNGQTIAAAQTDKSPNNPIKQRFKPAPLNSVRLKPSIFLDSVNANQKYLLSLSADRLLHNFYKNAGLEPKGPIYGGWEAKGIAGHTLGHYQSACALQFAQTGNTEFKKRALYVSKKLREFQIINKDGYTGGTTVDRDGKTIDGKIVYEEIRKGDIRTSGFDLNGGWVPLYTYHKVFAGAIDAYKFCNDKTSLDVALGLGDYLGTIFEGLSDAQMQQILRAEHGGLNESFAELYAITTNDRWLKLAQKVYHRAILEPLTQGKDELNGKHSNTQIPKLIGLARIYELNNDANAAKASLFFYEAITKDHSYVIGGNSNFEHLGEPKKLSKRLGQQTCECCNTYNMLKLTRHLYSWSGDKNYFDFYERAHLNHIMSQQDPKTGMFSYFSPLASGFARVHSSPENDFWCCVGSGIESHSKHGESIYWANNNTLFVNLFYPSSLNWEENGISLDINTEYPNSESISIKINNNGKKIKSLALRIPNWCKAPKLTRNNKLIKTIKNGYFYVEAPKKDDVLILSLPMQTYYETMQDDESLGAYLNGPLVLAADLGNKSIPWENYDPAIIGNSFNNQLLKTERLHEFNIKTNAKPTELNFKPYYSLHESKTAVYIKRFNKQEWAIAEVNYIKEAKERSVLLQNTIDYIRLGEMQPERDHNLDATPNTEAITHIALRGRIIQKGYIEFDLNVLPNENNKLLFVYSGNDRNKNFKILIDDKLLVNEKLEGEHTISTNIIKYDVPMELSQNKTKIRLRIEAENDQWTSLYEVRSMKAEAK